MREYVKKHMESRMLGNLHVRFGVGAGVQFPSLHHFILARGGQTYARLRLNAGPGAEVVLPVEVDFTQSFPASAFAAWECEYHQSVQQEQRVTCEPARQRDSWAKLFSDSARHTAQDPYLADPFWDDHAFYSYMESIDDRDRPPF